MFLLERKTGTCNRHFGEVLPNQKTQTEYFAILGLTSPRWTLNFDFSISLLRNQPISILYLEPGGSSTSVEFATIMSLLKRLF
jgi:hypothetical protein